MQYSQWPIARKLALLCLAFGLVPVALVATFILNRSTNTVRERTADRLREAAGHVADKIDRNLFERYGDVQAFGFNEVVRDSSQWYKTGAQHNRIADRMNAYVAAYGLYPITQLVDPSGRVMAVNDLDATGTSINTSPLMSVSHANEPWLTACMSGQFTRSMAYSAKGNTAATGTIIEAAHTNRAMTTVFGDNAEQVIGFAAPVRGANGLTIGCWRNLASVSLVRGILADAQSSLVAAGYAHAVLTVVDSTGRPLTSVGDSTLVPTLLETMKSRWCLDHVACLASRGRSRVISAVPATQVAYAHLTGALGYPGMNWGVLISVPQLEVGCRGQHQRAALLPSSGSAPSSPSASYSLPCGSGVVSRSPCSDMADVAACGGCRAHRSHRGMALAGRDRTGGQLAQRYRRRTTAACRNGKRAVAR
ncbi:hypothetical protein [Gemmatimonas sp.]|uniref:hypothetical protein n=1 Tax=Gemmatimonas sp. TaxID=1962908 RepID=UPI003DA21028